MLGEGDRVQIHFRVHSSAGLSALDFRELEREVVALTRTWDDELRDRLVERHGEAQGRALAAQWAPRFPRYYKASRSPQLAMHDIGCFVRLETLGEPFVVGLQNETDQTGERTRVGLYKAGGKVELADAMPMLEDLGLRVIEEVPTRLKGGDGETWVQDFGVLGPGDRPLDLDAHGARVADCISAVWRGDTESDSLNRLVLAAGLDWRQIEILRAYRKYRQRIGSRFTESYQNDVLVRNAALTEKLVHLFELRFDPEHARDEGAEVTLREQIIAGLDEVESLDDDRILRNQLGLIEATLRTNAYRRGRGAMSFKLRSADVPAIPQPAPLMEIYVYSSAMEGIHLRGGRIARGGIRWSDRQDYRTEVLGLMRAQLTKNAQIVPEGAKGGFYLKQRPSEPSELREEVQRQYVAYVRALLDVTDNLVDGEVVHPPDVRVLDEDDTYLVVAADKGTATFSDTANGVAEDYGFWLGDAFASGGSSGYDHKKLGITARGAWESVKRHLRELEIDPDSDPFTVVGIGDMSGDVFGNGMLLSDRIRLVGAYDHRHIFIDPDPDPDVGFAERRRLFDLAGSSWNDYDRAKISEGGGVWPRAAKRIPLSDAVAARARDRGRGARAQRPDPRHPAGARRPALERRHRDRRQGVGRVGRRGPGPLERRDPRRRLRAALPGRGGGRQPRLHAPGARRVRARRRADQRRLHRQLRRRRLLGSRGQPEDPARARGAPRGADPPRPRRPARRHDRGRGRPRALRLLPAGADHRPGGGALGRAARRLRGPHGRAGGGRPARPRLGGAAHGRGAGRPPPRGPRDGAPRAREPADLREAAGQALAARLAAARRPVARAATCARTSRTRSSSASAGCSASIRCGAS